MVLIPYLKEFKTYNQQTNVLSNKDVFVFEKINQVFLFDITTKQNGGNTDTYEDQIFYNPELFFNTDLPDDECTLTHFYFKFRQNSILNSSIKEHFYSKHYWVESPPPEA